MFAAWTVTVPLWAAVVAAVVALLLGMMIADIHRR